MATNMHETKMLVQLTVEELAYLIRSILAEDAPAPHNPATCSGTKELAAHLSCCESTIYALRRDGVLDDAVISQIGRRIVYNIDRARELANEYLGKKRSC